MEGTRTEGLPEGALGRKLKHRTKIKKVTLELEMKGLMNNSELGNGSKIMEKN